ncbi:MAG: hypothetical protein AB2L24_14030 [Mangrovibacterium sp.]
MNHCFLQNPICFPHFMIRICPRFVFQSFSISRWHNRPEQHSQLPQSATSPDEGLSVLTKKDLGFAGVVFER